MAHVAMRKFADLIFLRPLTSLSYLRKSVLVLFEEKENSFRFWPLFTSRDHLRRDLYRPAATVIS